MPRYRLRVAYDGTNFHGWQKQILNAPEGPTELRTAQGVLETAVADVVREPVNVVGASRTDAGVHAVGQVAAFTCSKRFEPSRLCAAINARMPADVQVRGAELVADDFSPISEAIAKGYRYRIAWGRDGPDGAPRPLFARTVTFWTPYLLDPGRMNEAARRLLGEHDFASFTRKHHNRESTVRTVFECMVNAGRGRRVITGHLRQRLPVQHGPHHRRHARRGRAEEDRAGGHRPDPGGEGPRGGRPDAAAGRALPALDQVLSADGGWGMGEGWHQRRSAARRDCSWMRRLSARRCRSCQSP